VNIFPFFLMNVMHMIVFSDYFLVFSVWIRSFQGLVYCFHVVLISRKSDRSDKTVAMAFRLTSFFQPTAIKSNPLFYAHNVSFSFVILLRRKGISINQLIALSNAKLYSNVVDNYSTVANVYTPNAIVQGDDMYSVIQV